MRIGLTGRAAMVGVLALAGLGACGDDDDDSAATTTTEAGAETGSGTGGENELSIEMVDYGYKVSGSIKAGRATVSTTNTGKEWHMAGFGKLKEGVTVAQLGAALAAGGESEEDPTAKFIEKELNSPGQILQPGQSQSLTVDVFEPGNYVMVCFLPTEGEGTPHFAKGMISGFEVAAGDSGLGEPDEDVAITLGDDAEPANVPGELGAGKRTFKITSDGAKGKDFIIAQLNEGKAFGDFDTYFESEFEKEGGPAKGAAAKAPGTIFGSTFAVEAGETIWMTVDLKPGATYFVSTTNSDEGGEETTEDKFVKVDVT
jgi:hypothetical protein